MRVRRASGVQLLVAVGALLAGCSRPDLPSSPKGYGPQFDLTSSGSPQGKIAFHSFRDGDGDIYVMNVDGSGVFNVTNTTDQEFDPIWSPNGQQIAFGRCEDGCPVFFSEVWSINANGTGLTQLTHGGGFPGAWSPDGTRIAFVSARDGDDEVYTMNTDGSDVTQITHNDGIRDFPTAWSPDGSQIMFQSDRDGNSELYVMNVDGTGVTRLTDDPASDEGDHSGWSPDGQRIVFSSRRDGGDLDVFTMNPDGSGIVELTPNDFIDDDDPVWSPDGQQIAFHSTRSGPEEIYVMNADGSGVIQLTFGGGAVPAWVLQPPPANDDFANATGISGLPFDDVVDLSLAGTEPGEPTPSCAIFFPLGNTVWYSFTATGTQAISAGTVNASIATVVAAYSGNSVGGLTELGCGVFGNKATFNAQAGTTYHVLVGGLFGQRGHVEFRLEVTPPPVAGFNFFPSDPSMFDVIQFSDGSFDPGGLGIATQDWHFAGGGTATGCCPTHTYAPDGSYATDLTVTTPDGRSASTSQTVLVRTHDVTIAKFSAPNAASSGQTRQLVVGLSNKRYPETVEVLLFKSIAGGSQLVQSLTQAVPVRASGRTTDFNFSYTFTAADASIGKVTFKGIANLVGARDALSADNEAIAPPTSVSPSNAAVRCLRPPAGLRGWWPGDGDARDIIGGNDGTLGGDATFAAAKVLQGFSFDGAGDDFGAAGTAVNDLQRLTIAAWVKHNALPPGRIERYVTLGGEKAVLRYDGFGGSAELHFYMRINGELQHIRVDNVLQVGVFQHVAGSYDGAVMRLYLDGVEVGSLPITGTVDPGLSVEFSSSIETLDGLLDEVQIFDRALTASEVRAIFEADVAGLCKKRSGV